jgi:hypothetical protein
MKPARPGNPKVKPAVRKFRDIVENLRAAYALSADQEYIRSSAFVGKARKAMDDLFVMAEDLARQGIGIPFPLLKK